jgi:hypothetical protein
MPFRLEALRATREVIGDPSRQIEALLGTAGFAGGMIKRMARYPAQQPPYGAGVSLGRRAGARTRKGTRVGPKQYRRTGDLGRGWRMTALGRRGDEFYSEVANQIPYGPYVQGKSSGRKGERQTAVMASKGWQSITPEAHDEWARWRPLIVRVLVQTDTRKERL